jgi:apolipoprotein D and lipocalin family protein
VTPENTDHGIIAITACSRCLGRALVHDVIRLPRVYRKHNLSTIKSPGHSIMLRRFIRIIRLSPALASLLLISACAGGLPRGIEPVQGFKSEQYLGTWYEIARLDHRFERGLSNVSATYSVRDDGQLRVVNQGLNAEGDWSQAEGRARFARNRDEGYLNVSFFGPFYGTYAVFELDEDYTRAYVAGNDRSYLWFLSRTRTVTDAQRKAFITRAAALGFPVDKLIFVDQSVVDRPAATP